MYVPIKDGKSVAQFGEPASRAYTGNTPSITIPTKKFSDTGYTADEIQTMLNGAQELETSIVAHDFQITDNMVWKVTSNKDYNQNLLPSDNGTYKNGGEVPVIIANGATLTLQSGNTPQHVCFIISEGATLHINGYVNMPNGARIINAGGTITGADGATFIVNNGSNGKTNYNAGTIKVNELNVNGGTLYNNGTIEVNTYRNTTDFNRGANSELINYGSVHVKGDAYLVNSTVSNGCKLYVDGNVSEPSVVTLGDNSFMKVGGVYLTAAQYANGGSHLKLGKSAMISVNEFKNNGVTITTPASASDPSEYAYIYWAKVSMWNSAGPITGYYAIDATAGMELYNGQYDYEPNWQYTPYATFTYDCMGELWPYKNEVANQHANVSAFTVTEPSADECAASVKFGTVPPDNVDPVTATYVFEDLGSIGDYDFNDVVVVARYNAETQKVALALAAAGGTLDTHVYYNSTDLGEVHNKFGVSLATMINTANRNEKSEVALGTFDMGENTIATLPITIRVSNNGASRVITAPEVGTAPQALIIPDEWEWPNERQMITNAYPDFGTFAAGVNVAADWYKNKR